MIPNWLSFVDVGFVAVALLFAWGGAQKGFAAQIAHLLAFVVMGVALFFAYPWLFSHLGRLFRDLEVTFVTWILLLGLLALTISAYLGFHKLVANIVKTQLSDRADHAWGLLLGLLRGAAVALFAMIFLVILNPAGFYDAFRMKSQVGKLVCYEIIPRIQPNFTRPMLEEKVQKLRSTLLQQEEGGKLE